MGFTDHFSAVPGGSPLFSHRQGQALLIEKTMALMPWFIMYPEPESNRYGHFWPLDFKSSASTYSAIRAEVFGDLVVRRLISNIFELVFDGFAESRKYPY